MKDHVKIFFICYVGYVTQSSIKPLYLFSNKTKNWMNESKDTLKSTETMEQN